MATASSVPSPLRTPPAIAHGSEYAQLSKQVRQAGLMRRRPGYYTAKIVTTLGLFVVGWTVFGLLGRSWYQLLIAAFLAVAFTQLAFLGHDAGHRQILATRTGNDRRVVAYCANRRTRSF
jgi:fatty acid desaturase